VDGVTKAVADVIVMNIPQIQAIRLFPYLESRIRRADILANFDERVRLILLLRRGCIEGRSTCSIARVEFNILDVNSLVISLLKSTTFGGIRTCRPIIMKLY